MTCPLWLLVVLVAVSTCQLTETFRHGSIFERARAWLESHSNFCAQLIGCGFCFSHWAAALAVLLCLGHILLAARGWYVDPFMLIMIWLTGIRGANLMNDLTKQWSRTPSRDGLMLPDLDSIEPFEDNENGDTEAT